ncbi:hypothetical protein M430DRAFT_20738 [Amorphotheca resinae ATCC 22711]|uniref:WSC domain-containing protein n=1 Tax=Amorphotheca resinae ATCC 22711 TaxID=857342 RepID=A0A2T3AVY9_AMORE|nr:hypothetical protein M430DRAFT_20738 [Amorphotheca resinae ATCC 22711]PSS12823.1 hypothetical protein M430DRAFT_20738 [Amorphotheca resinae ATCC 22711]
MIRVSISTFRYSCITRCQAYNYNAAGIELGTQYYCDDVENILIASDQVAPALVDDSKCSVACSGQLPRGDKMTTDVFCAAGLTLPDKGGRQLSVGDWNGNPNGGVEGETSKHNVQQPTLEFIPAIGVPDPSAYSGNSNAIDITIEARILDEVTGKTTKTLPNTPGAVNDDTGGRTYSLEGSMSLMPQYVPYTDPLTVLICGGSTPGGHYALDNCVSIQLKAQNSV